MMRNCKSCTFCKCDLINNYIKEADLYKCDMDGDIILDPYKEGRECVWFKANVKKHESLLTKIKDWLHFKRGLK